MQLANHNTSPSQEYIQDRDVGDVAPNRNVSLWKRAEATSKFNWVGQAGQHGIDHCLKENVLKWKCWNDSYMHLHIQPRLSDGKKDWCLFYELCLPGTSIYSSSVCNCPH